MRGWYQSLPDDSIARHTARVGYAHLDSKARDRRDEEYVQDLKGEISRQRLHLDPALRQNTLQFTMRFSHETTRYVGVSGAIWTSL